MFCPRKTVRALVCLTALTLTGGLRPGTAELRWPEPKKESMRVRLVALAWNHPRASFFSSQEMFIAEKELDKDESRLVKLVYDFLPYQPRLSEFGLEYATVHELRAVRDASCDETLASMMGGGSGDWRQQSAHLKYSTDAPALSPVHHKSHLPCYVTTATDYSRPIREIANPDEP